MILFDSCYRPFDFLIGHRILFGQTNGKHRDLLPNISIQDTVIDISNLGSQFEHAISEIISTRTSQFSAILLKQFDETKALFLGSKIP